jgi:hypothetical protein
MLADFKAISAYRQVFPAFHQIPVYAGPDTDFFVQKVPDQNPKT